MTRNELLQEINQGRAYRFVDLPQELLDKETLSAWLKSLCGNFKEIPAHFIDDDLRRIAVGRSPFHLMVREYPLASIKKEDTHCYEELVLIALAQCQMNMTHVDPSLYSEAFFLKALEVNPVALLTFLTGDSNKARIEWTEAMVDSATSKDFRYLEYLPKERIKQQCVERLITDGQNSATELEEAGLLDLMSHLMRGGYWPQATDKPSFLQEAIDLLQNNHPSAENMEVYYRAFIRSHRVEAVLPLMASPDLQSLMLRVYSTRELMPHLRTGLIKGAGRVKGTLLEDGLGL
jgi:hypothetical protein